MIIIWSILAVERFHPINRVLYAERQDHYCANAFETVMRATLVFFQTLIAGDSWGTCSIPVIEAQPAYFIVFAEAFVTIQLGFTNLVLAIIVDKAQEAKETSKSSRRSSERFGPKSACACGGRSRRAWTWMAVGRCPRRSFSTAMTMSACRMSGH